MDLLRLGAALRGVRLSRGWRQADVARRAGVSGATVSRLERGHASSLSLAVIERVAAVLEIRLELVARWRGGELDRMLAGGHAALHDQVAVLLVRNGWQVVSEATFSVFVSAEASTSSPSIRQLVRCLSWS